MGWSNIYGSGVTGWRAEHPEAWVKGIEIYGSLIPGASLDSDRRRYAAFPHGVPQGIPFYRFFAHQWGALSKAVGINALVLRDGMWGQVEYSETGPYGTCGSSNPADMSRWSNWTSSLIRETKQANPQCLVIGYSTAASAVSEWRLDGFDLEQIAKEGFLDAWIDQSWGAVWGENESNYQLGCTFQLAYILLHAAQLAHTPVRHYVLIATWDAWEPWDTIHAVPYKMQWEIWAYTHAAVKTPEGEKVPRGMYFSWVNHGDELWTTRDVALLAKTSEAATADALSMRETCGPTLVYNREFLRWLNHEHPNWLVKEFIDDHAGMLMKWRVPILSITRLEWLSQVRSDMFIFQAPGHLDPDAAEAMLKLYRAGEPIAIISDPTYGIDPRLREILQPPCTTLDQEWNLEEAIIKTKVGSLTDNLPEQFKAWQGNYKLAQMPTWGIVSEGKGCPELILESTRERRWVWWNPPFFSPQQSRGKSDRSPLGGLVPNVEPYVLASRAVLKLLQDAGRSPFDPSMLVERPLAAHYWRKKDGSLMLLLGNLERGIHGGSESTKLLWLRLSSHFVSLRATKAWLSKVTQETPGVETLHLRRDPEGQWLAEIPVWPMGSSVWILDLNPA